MTLSPPGGRLSIALGPVIDPRGLENKSGTTRRTWASVRTTPKVPFWTQSARSTFPQANPRRTATSPWGSATVGQGGRN